MGSLLSCLSTPDGHYVCSSEKTSQMDATEPPTVGPLSMKRGVAPTADVICKRLKSGSDITTDVLSEYTHKKSVGESPGLHIDQLPQSLLLCIFSHLSLYDLLERASVVSRYWHQVAYDQALWRHIDMSEQKRVTDSVLAHITRLSRNVVSMNLSDSRLVTNDGVVVIARNCPHLQVLKLIRCMWLKDEAVTAVADHCTQLQELYLDTCFELSDSALEKIGSRCSKLQLLQVNQCTQITDIGVNAIAKGCPVLHTLSLEHCKKVKGTCLPDLVAGCADLEVINCINCDFSVETLHHFTKFRRLRVLELSQISSVTNACVMEIVRHCHEMETLNLSLCTNVTDEAIEFIARHARKIRNLYLVSCALTDHALLSLGAHSRTIENVDVGWCEEITDAGAVQFSQICPTLQYLGLMRCDLVTIPTMEFLVGRYPHIKYSTMWLDCMRLIERARNQGYLLPDFPAANVESNDGGENGTS